MNLRIPSGTVKTASTHLRPAWSDVRRYLLYGLALLGLYFTSYYSYLLFHSLAELFSIAIAGAIFILAVNTWRLLKNNYLAILGVAYLFVGGIDLLHTLAYEGMDVFRHYDANLPTQLWIAARLLQSLSLLAAPQLFEREVKLNRLIGGYGVATALLVATIFGRLFPDCYIEGVGLTPFKRASEYMIVLILLVALIHLWQERARFDRMVFNWLAGSVGLTMLSELAFTFYTGTTDFSNLVGHLLKIGAFYLVYQAIVHTGLNEPYRLLFRDLKQSEESLRTSEGKLRAILNNTQQSFMLIDQDYRVQTFNQKAQEIAQRFFSRAIRPGDSIYNFIMPAHIESFTAHFQRAWQGEDVSEESKLQDGEGRDTWFAFVYNPVIGDEGQVTGVCFNMANITGRKQAEQTLNHYARRLETMHELDQAILAAQSPETIAQAAVARIRQLVPCRRASVLEFDGETNEARVLAAEGAADLTPGLRLALPEPGWLEKLAQGQPHLLAAGTPPLGGPEQSLWSGDGDAILMMPLLAHDDLIGVLALGAPGGFAADQVTTAGEVATSLAVAIRQARLLEKIQEEAQARTTLLQEVNHRVKNNLAGILSLLYAELYHNRKDSPATSQEIIRDLINRVQGLATVHHLLSASDWSPLLISELVNQVISSALKTVPADKQVLVQVEPVSGRISARQASSLALIVNELATNTVKYALVERSTAHIQVGLSLDGDLIRLEFRDDGPGLPEEVLRLESQNVGMYLIRTLVESGLQGKVNFHNDHGTVAVISFRITG